MNPNKPVSLFGQLKRMAKGRQPLPADIKGVNLNDLRKAVGHDQGLRSDQKESVLQLLGDPDFVAELKSGAIGAGLMYLIAKYLKLKPTTQILLSLAGYGVGKLIYDYKHDPKRFSTYNEQLKMYEIR